LLAFGVGERRQIIGNLLDPRLDSSGTRVELETARYGQIATI